jgi:hypoxanthine phosphoribosyltransferase
MTQVIHGAQIIQARVSALAREISADYAGRELHVVCLINGAMTFCADLVRQITVPTYQHALGFSSYSGAPPSGEVRVTLDVAEPLQRQHVLVVEGIVVSGRTPKYVMDLLRLRQPASLAMCALGRKAKAIAVDLEVRYVAFEFGDEIAVGYGVGKGPDRAWAHLADQR